ncbi:hypothetical protein KSP40_PGU013417 [Platanthera guangdongensis]|uniref:Uncharacterized protein n=1 Tax=Platanthera guangdongensis TaxID=2320717 RepID=A0ABR2M6B7_9ASPA
MEAFKWQGSALCSTRCSFRWEKTDQWRNPTLFPPVWVGHFAAGVAIFLEIRIN